MLLQPKLNLKVSQRQVLTPGLVQMVSVLALNKLELKEMINTEMVENPVLEELEESAVSLEERADGRGTIRFQPQIPMWGNRGWSSWTPSTDPTQFLLIPDARSVFDRIQKAAKTS